jgi:hypothetical protein
VRPYTLFDGGRIDVLEVLEAALIVLAADVERQGPALAAGVDQGFGGVEIALCEAVLLENVAPAASTRGETQS